MCLYVDGPGFTSQSVHILSMVIDSITRRRLKMKGLIHFGSLIKTVQKVNYVTLKLSGSDTISCLVMQIVAKKEVNMFKRKATVITAEKYLESRLDIDRGSKAQLHCCKPSTLRANLPDSFILSPGCL